MSLRYYEVDVREVADRLRRELEALDRIKLAVLFGSVLRRSLVRDVDVAVYAVPRMSLPEILGLEGRLEEAVEVPVDLVPLDRAPPAVRLAALVGGVVLVQRGIARSDLVKAALDEEMGLRLKVRQSTLGRGGGEREGRRGGGRGEEETTTPGTRPASGRRRP